MRTKTVNAKRLVVLAAVVIICAACLVSAAYAYNATYKDTVSQQGLTPDETAKYIYVNSSETAGLELPTLQVSVAGSYDSTTDNTAAGNGKIELSNQSYKITALSGTKTSGEGDSAKTQDDLAYLDTAESIAYIKLGTLTVVNHEADVSTVTLSVSSCTAALDSTGGNAGKVSIIDVDKFNKAEDKGTYVKFVTAGTAAGSKVAENYLTDGRLNLTDNTAQVDVYLVVPIAVDFTGTDNFSHQTYEVDPSTGEIVKTSGDDTSNKLSTTLVIPSISVEIKAVGTDDAAAAP